MLEEEKEGVTQPEEGKETEPGGTDDPASIILKLKENTVPKDKYKELEDKYRRTLKQIADGDKIEVEAEHTLTEDERTKRITELRKQLFSRDCETNNLDYWKNALELRKHLMDSGKPDPFIGKGKMFKDDGIDQPAEISKAVDVIQSCIDKCEGNSKLFTTLLNEKLEDDPVIAMKMLRNKTSRR